MMDTVFVHGLFGAVPSNIRAFRTDSADNNVSTADTIAEMRRVAIQSSKHPVVIQAINIATRNLPSDANLIAQSAAIFQWVKGHVQFVKHEDQQYELFGLGPDNQLLITPERLLTMPSPEGDCAVYSTLLAAMLIPLGVGVSFVTVGADPKEPQRYSHVYVIAKYPCGKVISLDGSHGEYFGWETQNVSKRKEWNIIMPLVRAGHAGWGSKQLGIISARGMGDAATDAAALLATADVGSPPTYAVAEVQIPSYTYTPIPAPTPSINGGALLTSAVNAAITDTSKILTAQYAGPTVGLKSGQTYQTVYNPKTGMYEQVASSSPAGTTTSSLFGGMDSTTLLLLLGVGLIVLMSSAGGGRR